LNALRQSGLRSVMVTRTDAWLETFNTERAHESPWPAAAV
jgi:hypothetical protein